MTKQQIDQFVQNIFTELEKQSHSFVEMKNMMGKQSISLQNEASAHLQKTNSEKSKLIDLIKNHHKKLLAFKLSWCKLKIMFPEDVQSRIHKKIEEIVYIVKSILSTEKQKSNKF